MVNVDKCTQLVNFKKVIFGNGNVEYRFYNRPIKVGVEKSIDKVNYIDLDGFQVNTQSGEIRTEKSINHSLNSSLSRTINTIYDLSSCNIWDWFLTFTFDKEKVDRYNYDDCLKKLSKFLNNLKTKKCNDLKYLVVPEMHKDGAFHFHGLLSGVPDEFFVHSGVKDIYNFTPYKFGFSTATRVTSTHKVSNYITKYITKDLISLGKRQRYLCSNGLSKPDIVCEYIPPDELVRLKIEYISKCNYSKEIKIDNANQIITYAHFNCGSGAT